VVTDVLHVVDSVADEGMPMHEADCRLIRRFETSNDVAAPVAPDLYFSLPPSSTLSVPGPHMEQSFRGIAEELTNPIVAVSIYS